MEGIVKAWLHFVAEFDDDCHTVVKSISILAAKYYCLGMALGLKSSALDTIKSENPQNCDVALREVIKRWLSGADLVKGKQTVTPSWKTLAIAVDDSTGGSNPALAKRIATDNQAKTTKKEKQGAQGQGGRSRSGSTPACPSPATKKKELEGRASLPAGASGSKSAQSSPSTAKKEQSAASKKGANPGKAGSASASLAVVSPLEKKLTAAGHNESQAQKIQQELFVTPPIDEAICKKCKNVAREPMHPSCCEKEAKCMLCKPCSEKSKCPHHKKTPERWTLDQTLKTRISKWTMTCPNQCGDKFTVSKLDKHLTECPKATKGTPKSVPKRASR